MFNQARFDYLKALLEQDKLSDSLRKEFAALLKEQQIKKVLYESEEE